jgi:hypothetical protein
MAREKTVRDLENAARVARTAQTVAEEKLEKRDLIALELADRGVKYLVLAAAMGITTDGVTYVLRKVRKGRTDS